MVLYNFKEIHVVPPAKQLVDVVLSRTQRKTPTVVHKRYKISRIRNFYMRKVKFTQSSISERLSHILDNFPRVVDLHPFYRDLIHILYDKDHYKLALGQLNTAKNICDQLAKEYVKQLKYGDSLFRCKALKRAALGRMCTILKKQDVSLRYLEQVRQHLARLPSIDPNTRTLILTGFPNVGKSSFINKISRAKVEVQPYAFTTKSIFVGHTDYKYLRWQVLDTPGILDHPIQVLDECNNIEMQAVTALAHIHSCVIFFVDLSPHCEHSIEKQIHLFQFLEPIFANKPIVVVANKADLRKMSELDDEEKLLIKSITEDKNIPLVEMSNLTDEGIAQVKQTACEALLARRVASKMRSKKVESIANRIHVSKPTKRDNKVRSISIPDSVLAKRRAKASKMIDVDEDERRTLKDVEREHGGAGVFQFDIREHWKLENPEWQFDRIPETLNGENIADWIDPDIEKRLEELERQEAQLEAEEEAKADADGMRDDDGEDSLDEDEQDLYEAVVKKTGEMRAEKAVRQNGNKVGIYRRTMDRSFSSFANHLSEMGIETTKLNERVERARSKSRVGRKRARSVSASREDSKSKSERSAESRSRSRSRSLSVKPHGTEGLSQPKQKLKARKLKHAGQYKRSKYARSGPGDMRVYDFKPKHLFTGTRGIGKTDRR